MAIPQGKKAAIPRTANRYNFIIPAHSISARCLPEYSRTMASWIMVSSRCVAGLSTGTLPVSARAIRMKDKSANTSDGLSIACPPWAMTMVIWDRDVDLLTSDTANTAISMAGSASEAMVISLLEPMPPKAVPISMPANAVKNRAMANSATSTITSAIAESGRSVESVGMMLPAMTETPNTR